MTIPMWSLLGFASWTILVLMCGVGIRRWGRILRGQASLTSFPADTPHGDAAYRRAMRAHANCVENMPVYGAIVLCGQAAGVTTPAMDALALVVLAGRVAQSSVHMLFPETNGSVGLRFSFFLAQVAAMITMIVIVAEHAGVRDVTPV